MLPAELRGPGKLIASQSPDAFLSENLQKYPGLDRDFILQICFEHPRRFDALLPGFRASEHCAQRVTKTAEWVNENVRYDEGALLDFWFNHFDAQMNYGHSKYDIFIYMTTHKVWPFPPVVIEANFAISIGAPSTIGRPYHLIEGTHRVSYLLRMLQRGLVESKQPVELIEVATCA